MEFQFLKIVKSAKSGILELLDRNIIGTPGSGMLYQHTSVADKIKNIPAPYFVSLVKFSRIVATCCFCRRITINNGQQFDSFYVRYFSFDERYRSKSVVKKQITRNSALRREVHATLSGAGLDLPPAGPFFHYAYVDPNNIRSAKLCAEFGFETVRRYATIIFSRLNPTNKSSQVHKLPVEEQPKMKTLLSSFYQNFNMFSFENLFAKDSYHVIKDNSNNILAGAQVNRDRWKILTLQGFYGRALLKIFTALPILKKLINKDYTFITVEGIFYQPGAETKLEILFESLLYEYKVNSAIIVVDLNSDLYRTLKSLRLGVVDKLNHEVGGNVICRFVNFTDSDKSKFRSSPAYISGIDVT